ncbi:MAG: glycosyltransferase family 39 protein [Bdellovibrionaceae bacterium]|nr:glycosyltransferase family 39 protein [Pseudobdellovibrionaceae bacterium]
MPYVLIFALTFLFRLFFALNVNLIDDEAYHWSWTKDLMLSYYDHPGMIAWLNYLATSLFGDTIIGIRLTSFIFYTLTIVFTWKLAEDIFDRKIAFFVTQLLLWTPFWGFGGYVNAPEPVFFFFWISSAWVFWQSIRPDNKRWSVKTVWLILGVTMGLGLNSKFVMAMLAFGFGVFLLSTPNYRRMLLSPWPWIGVVIATIICMPIFLWNIEYDWPGFKYQFQGRHTGGGFSIERWLQWFGTQFLFYTPPIYLLVLGAIPFSIKKFQDLRFRFLFCLFIPSLVVFYIQPFFAEYKPHWSGPATLFMTMTAAYLYYNGLDLFGHQLVRPQSRKWLTSILIIFVLLNTIIYSPFIYPFMPKVHRAISSAPWDTRNDLSNEFFGWEDAGSKLLERQRQIHSETGKKPFLAAIRYETTAQTIWGTKDSSIVMLNKFVSHYTVMQKKRNTLEALVGMDSLILTTEKYPDDPMEYANFDTCEKTEYKYYRLDEHSRTFYFWFCQNFKGVKY